MDTDPMKGLYWAALVISLMGMQEHESSMGGDILLLEIRGGKTNRRMREAWGKTKELYQQFQNRGATTLIL